MARRRYKFVEVQPVTAAGLEEVVNRWVADDWQLERVSFAGTTKDGRPAIAFVALVREPLVGAIELGELDLGEPEPFDAEVEWSASVLESMVARRRGVVPLDAGIEEARGGRGAGEAAEPAEPDSEPAEAERERAGAKKGMARARSRSRTRTRTRSKLRFRSRSR